MSRFLVVSTVKNEGAFFLEWLAWNRLIGFTDFLIYQNDSVDGTKDLLRVLQENGFIEFVDNDGANFASPQRYSYRQASQSEAFSRADWAMAIDVDEFPLIRVGDGTLPALLREFPQDTDEIRLNWLPFGNDGHVLMSPELVTERFLSTISEWRQCNQRLPTKTLFRPTSFSWLGVHSPKRPQKATWKSYNGSGRRIDDPVRQKVGFSDSEAQKFGAIYHYMVKDISNFVLKCDRGKSGHVNREMKARYWRHWTFNDLKDHTLAGQSDRIQQEMARINEACGGLPFELQARAYTWRQKRFSELMETDEYAGMMREICEYEGVEPPDDAKKPAPVESSPATPAAAEETPEKPTINHDFSLMQDLAMQEDGEFHETENYVVVHLPGKDRLLCGFDNLSSIKSEGPRKPWAFELARARGWGVLGVMVKRNDWFQSPDLYPVLEGMRDDGVFAGYPNVTMYGSSMGAFGAAAFAGLAPGCTVVAFGPQSSLAADLAPFDGRYKFAKRASDWSTGPYRDAAVGIRAAGKAYLVHDPMVAPDRKHVERLLGQNSVDLRWPFLTHKIPPAFRRMNVLKPMALEMIEGTMTRARFVELMQERKTCIAYLVRMLDGAADRGHHKLGLAAARKLRATKDNWRVRQVERRLRRELRARDPSMAELSD